MAGGSSGSGGGGSAFWGGTPVLSDVLIGDRMNWANTKRLRGVTGLSLSWELSRAGILRFELPLRDLLAYSLHPLDLLAKWVYYDHATAGPWGGLITNVTPKDGIVTVSAESWAALFRGLPTFWSGAERSGLIGELVQQLWLQQSRSGISVGTIDGGWGDPAVEPDFIQGGEDMYESYLPKTLTRWNETNGWQYGLHAAGWNIDPATRRFSFDATYGEDKSATVQLHDGLHNTAAEWADDMTDIINVAVIDGEYNTSWSEGIWYISEGGTQLYTVITRYGRQPHTGVGINATSVARYGHREQRFDERSWNYPQAHAINAAAQHRATMLSMNQQLVTIECADVGGIWSRFREGDIVWAKLTNEGAQGRMVVRHRALDVTRGTMLVSGEAELF